MSTQLEDKLWQYPSVYITDGQLTHILGGTHNSRYARVNRAVKKGLLIRVRRGLYYLSRRLVSHSPHPYELAQLIYGPSYISLESALSYHGLIPEAVHSITSAAIKRKNEMATPLGQFIYHRLPTENFFIEVAHINEAGHQFFMASPWKALLDYIYCYKKTWYNLEPITESLRIELEELPKMNKKTIEQLKAFYHRKCIARFIDNLPKEYIDEY